jgi:hypothetical protein
MGRTIPSFRIATLMEEKRWKMYRQALDKYEQKIFKHMLSIAYLFNSTSSYAANPIRINPIMFSIVLYHQKKMSTLKKKSNENFFFNRHCRLFQK